ncbi:MAG TPA: protease inhibitor I9 family protein, partial [Phycicoccus sp.]|nr:protease inhibitor I9 family protein [Phycicoccus sp.]
MSTRALALTIAGATALGVVGSLTPASAAPSEGKLPWVVVMAELPAVAYEGGVAGLPATKPADGEKINARATKVKDYASHLKQKQAEALAGAGVSAKPVNQLTTAANGFAVQLTEVEAERVRQQSGVALVVRDSKRQKQTDASPAFLGLSSAGEAWATGLTGEGVVIGVID